MFKKEVFKPKQSPLPGYFSTAVKAGPFLFVSGQCPVLYPEGRLIKGLEDLEEADRKKLQTGSVPRDLRDGPFAAQTYFVLKTIDTILKEAGTNMDNLILLRYFVLDFDQYYLIEDIRKMFFTKENAPAITTVRVLELAPPGAMIEIEAIALIPENS